MRFFGVGRSGYWQTTTKKSWDPDVAAENVALTPVAVRVLTVDQLLNGTVTSMLDRSR